MDETSLITGFLFGLLGTAFFVYGKRAGQTAPMAAGLGLMLLAPMLPLVWGLTLAALLVSLPWAARRAG